MNNTDAWWVDNVMYYFQMSEKKTEIMYDKNKIKWLILCFLYAWSLKTIFYCVHPIVIYLSISMYLFIGKYIYSLMATENR